MFRDRHEQLTEKPIGNTILEIFAGLRREVTQSGEGLCRWVACLALVHAWRGGVETME